MSETALTLIESIRRRPGMFIGDMTIRGLKTMLEYFLDDIQEHNLSEKEVRIEFKRNNWIRIEANNIDTTSFVEGLSDLEKTENYSHPNLPILIALSKEIKIELRKIPSLIIFSAENGTCQSAATIAKEKIDGIVVEFQINPEIFIPFEINYEILNQSLRKYALIYNDFKIISVDSSSDTQQINVFNYPNGVSHELDCKIGKQLHGRPMLRLDLNKKIDGDEYKISFAYQDIWIGQTDVTTYANQHELIHGGSFIEGILEGIVSALNEVASQKKISININLNNVKEQLMLVGSVKSAEFRFGGSTKTSLDMPKLKEDVYKFVFHETLEYLKENEDAIFKVLQKYTID
jgi:DNA gyrase subunit B